MPTDEVPFTLQPYRPQRTDRPPPIDPNSGKRQRADTWDSWPAHDANDAPTFQPTRLVIPSRPTPVYLFGDAPPASDDPQRPIR